MIVALRRLRTPASFLLASLWLSTATAAVPPAGTAEALALGRPQDLIIEFDNRGVEREASDFRQQLGQHHDGPAVLQLKRSRYRQAKDGVRAALPAGGHETVADYDLLPLVLLRVRTPNALAALTGHRGVVGIYRDTVKVPVPSLTPQLDSQSSTLVGQPVAAAAGLTGAGTTVAVIDTGANYTVADLGSCTGVGIPSATCRVQHALYVNAGNQVVGDSTAVTSTSNNHGTNVAAIVAGVATATRISVINVFGTSGTTTDSKVLAAINWSIANQAAYNIRAVNLSLGDGIRHTSPCSSGNPYLSAFASARAAGIVPVVAAGNNGYIDGIASPACTPGAVSVGAVYAANYGSVGWSGCTDTTTAADKVACFSNGASFLTAVAPGAIITAGGLSYGGTSQAAPFIAAGMSLLSTAYPDETPDLWVTHLTSEARAVTDSRSGLVSPRLDLAAIAAAATVIIVNEGDVPTLPEWAALCLGGVLLAATLRQRRPGSPEPANARTLPGQKR